MIARAVRAARAVLSAGPALSGIALSAGIVLSGIAHAEPIQDSTTADTLSGIPATGAWSVAGQAGFPWYALRGQVGIGGKWAPVVEVRSALLARWEPTLGIQYGWVDRRWRIAGEVLAGWRAQGGELPWSGPLLDARLRAGRGGGRVIPAVMLGVRPSFTLDQTVVTGATGEATERAVAAALTLEGSLSLGVALTPAWGVEVGLDMHWVDVPAFTIPGLHLTLIGGRP